ncbi:DUF3558 domain-containing protein [Amycolatopsis sp. cg5]|uniref:DUF3558 domain-containing protein n=1 Tax=Amycolatopsis sp. cg5 TaxID=3238802 RepID=UPI003524E287
MLRTLALLSLGLLAGCTAEPAPAPPPPPPSTLKVGPPTSSTPAVDVPQVPKPLETGRFDKEPCAVLTAAQARSVYLLVKSELGQGATCQWRDAHLNGVRITFTSGDGLRGTYTKRAPGTGYFEPTTISGFPAVYAGQADQRNIGRCSMTIGLRNDEIMTVESDLGNASPVASGPCDVVKKAAEAAITTIKRG